MISGFVDYDNTHPRFTSGFDYNNDGFMDILVVDPKFDTQYIDAGALFVFLGPLDSSVDISSGTAADLMFSPEIASEFLGRYGTFSVAMSTPMPPMKSLSVGKRTLTSSMMTICKVRYRIQVQGHRVLRSSKFFLLF